MSENTKKPQIITLDNKEYDLNQMTPEQQLIVSHIEDLTRKIGSAQFSLDQLNVGKQAFVQLLKDKLVAPVDAPATTQ